MGQSRGAWLTVHASLWLGRTENPEIGAEGITVLALAERAELRVSSRLRRTTQTDQNGKFLLRGLAPGEYLVIALANLEPGGDTDPDSQKKFEKLATRVQLEAGQTKSEALTAMSTGASRQSPIR